VPVRNIFVCDAGGDVEHDDAALAVDIVTVTKTSELFLSSSIPDIELDVAQILDNGQWRPSDPDVVAYRAEPQRVNFNTKGRNVLLLELSSQMTLDEGGLYSSQLSVKTQHAPPMQEWGQAESQHSFQQQRIHQADRTHLSRSSITNKHELEGRDSLSSFSHGCGYGRKVEVEVNRAERDLSRLR
jgi:hypothetical protein